MKKVYLQYWEVSEKEKGIREDGCSLHISLIEHKKYIDNIYSSIQQDRDVNVLLVSSQQTTKRLK